MNVLVSDPHTILLGEKHIRCATGSGGISSNKREGDRATPAGTFGLGPVFYRSDRVQKPATGLETVQIEEGDLWCSNPEDERYNTKISSDEKYINEGLHREDSVFDVAIFIHYNVDPIQKGKGSGIFLHLAREGYPPTAGCIGVGQHDMLDILSKLNSTSVIKINETHEVSDIKEGNINRTV